MAGLLFHSPADIARWLLVQLGQGTDPTVTPLGAWPAYESVEPNAPDNCITCYDTTESSDGRVMIDGERQQHYGIQVRVRSATAKLGYAKAIALAIALDGVVGIGVTGTTLVPNSYLVPEVSVRGGVLYIGLDNPTTKRTLHTVNAILPINKMS